MARRAEGGGEGSRRTDRGCPATSPRHTTGGAETGGPPATDRKRTALDALHQPADRSRHGLFSDLFHGGHDVLLGDPPFDARFIVQADEDHRVIRLLGPELRRLLYEQLGPSTSLVPRDPTVVPRTVHQLAGIAEQIARQGAGDRPAGPCR